MPAPASGPGACLVRHHPAQLRHAGGRAHGPAGPHCDRLGARLQRPGSRRARVPPHRRPPSLFCPQREADLSEVIRAAQRTAATPPRAGADPAPRWTLRRLVGWVRARFGLVVGRETIRAALHRLKLSWKKAKKLLGRADPERRQAFIERVRDLLAGAQRDQHLLVYVDEAHIHQDADLGYGWGERGQRFFVASSSPGLSAKQSFYGLYLYNEGEVRLWPYPRANGCHTMDVLRRLIASSSCCGMARPTTGPRRSGRAPASLGSTSCPCPATAPI